MSNVIKLRHPVDGVQIRHGLGSLRGTASPQAYGGDGDSAQGAQGHPPITPVDEYHRGIEAGKAMAAKELSTRFEERCAVEHARVDAFLARVHSQVLSLHDRWEQSVTQFALSVAQLILKHEVSVNREIILGQVREALRNLVGAENVKIRVHPRDEEILRLHRTEVFTVSDSLRDLVIEVDEKIEPGGCIVESELGNVDARLSTQLKNLESQLGEENPMEAQR